MLSMRARLPLVLALASFVYGTANSGNDITTNYQNVCHVISTSISSKSAVHYPGKLCTYTKLNVWTRGGIYRQYPVCVGRVPLC